MLSYFYGLVAILSLTIVPKSFAQDTKAAAKLIEHNQKFITKVAYPTNALIRSDNTIAKLEKGAWVTSSSVPIQTTQDRCTQAGALSGFHFKKWNLGFDHNTWKIIVWGFLFNREINSEGVERLVKVKRNTRPTEPIKNWSTVPMMGH